MPAHLDKQTYLYGYLFKAASYFKPPGQPIQAPGQMPLGKLPQMTTAARSNLQQSTQQKPAGMLDLNLGSRYKALTGASSMKLPSTKNTPAVQSAGKGSTAKTTGVTTAGSQKLNGPQGVNGE